MRLGLNINTNTWNPTVSKNLKFWLRYNTGIELGEGTGVLHWNDNVAGSSLRWSQSTEDKQPTFDTTTKGVDFGGDHLLAGSQQTITGTFTIGFKVRIDDADASNDVVTGDTTAGVTNSWIRLNTKTQLGFKTSGSAKTLNVATSFESGDTVSVVVHRNASDEIQVYIDGVLDDTTVTSAGNLLLDSLGARGGSSVPTNYFSGQVYEFLIYDIQSAELSKLLSEHLMSIKIES